MLNETKYKIIRVANNTHYLQYLKSYKFWFFKWSRWEYIPYPNKYGHKIVCDQIPKFKNLKKFILTYPNIQTYFETEYIERKKQYS